MKAAGGVFVLRVNVLFRHVPRSSLRLISVYYYFFILTILQVD